MKLLLDLERLLSSLRIQAPVRVRVTCVPERRLVLVYRGSGRKKRAKS